MFAQRRNLTKLTSIGEQLLVGCSVCLAFTLLCASVQAQVSTPQPVLPPTLSDSKTQSTGSARELYSRAARSLVAKDLAQAATSLKQLIEQYPQDEIAPLAAMRLAQCYMTSAQSSEAIAVLEKWLPELAKSTQSRTLDPAAELEAKALLTRAYLMTAQYDRVIELAKQTTSLYANPSTISEGQQKSLQQIKSFAAAASQRREASQAGSLREAARLAREKKYSMAQATLQQVDTSLLSADWTWRYQVLCAQCLLGLGQPAQASLQLKQLELSKLQPKEQSVVRMLRMEAALATGSLSEAEHELAALADTQANSTQSNTTQDDRHQAATLDLRRTELALLRKDRATVDAIAKSARENYPQFESLHEFDLMLARNHLARIEFDEARKLLEAILQSPPSTDATAVPRAQWLLGESYLLSQDYAAAIAQYSRVIDGNRAPLWTESALMQRGKCYEMLGQAAAAQSDYNRLATDFPTSKLQDDARARSAQLKTTLK